MNNQILFFSSVTVLLFGVLVLAVTRDTCDVTSTNSSSLSSQELETDLSEIVSAKSPVTEKLLEDSSLLSTKKVVFEIDDVFDFKRFSLNKNGKEVLDSIAKQLKPDSTVIVVGHSDRIGSSDFNKKLSKKRADVVVKYLKTKSNAAFKSYGVGSLIPSGKTFSCEGKKVTPTLIKCLSPDRRVEIEFVVN